MDKSLFIARYRLNEHYKNLENWDEKVQDYLEQHAKYLNTLGQEGSLIFAGRTLLGVDDANLFGISVFKYSSKEELYKILKKDPVILYNIQSVEVFPFSMGIQFFKNWATY
ncbi:YciI family protein [Winogradskyella sp.]|uniref:YciI family protein n=1 Tax=Winogradskyella sp. TaxID=1883156 RepID=UPI003BA9E662